MATYNDAWRAGGLGQGAYILQSRIASEIPLIARGTAGQTANIFEAQNSAGTAVFTIDNNGTITFSGSGTISIDQTITGNLTVNGNTTIGNAVGDTLTVTATSTFQNPVTMSSTLGVTGITTTQSLISTPHLVLRRRGSHPSTIGSAGRLYTLAGDTDTTELWYMDAVGNRVQITDAGALEGSSLFWDDDEYVRMGNTAAAPDIRFGWNTTQTVDAFFLGLSDAQNTFVIAENGDRTFDFAHGAQTNPTVFVHSAAQDTTQWLSLAHNQTDAVITSGAGAVVINATALLPDANDAYALGVSGTAFSDVFLASGATIDFSASDIVLTHSANTLTMTGGNVVFTQPVFDAATPTAFTITGGAHTAITAATQDIGFNMDFSATKTWAAGAGPLAFQREILITGPTYSGTAGGALTITKAATLAINGAPTAAGGNLTITAGYAFYVEAGASRFDAPVTVAANLFIAQAGILTADKALYFDTGLKQAIKHATSQTSDAIILGLDTTSYSNSFIIAEWADVEFDFAHAQQTNPTVFIHSAAQSTTQWVSLAHNQTNAVIATGAGGIQFTQTAGTTGLTGFTFNIGAHTAITAATERIGIDVATVTKTWAAGAGPLAEQKEVVFRAPTYNGDVAGALTITDAATVYISGAPVQGTNMTLSNTHALWVDAGNVRFDGTLNATGGGALTGTWSDLGAVTTVDINGGTIDGVTIGGAVAGAITGTAITGTSFVIGGNTLTTAEWANLDGQNQTVATTSSPTFVNLTITSFAANWTNAGRTVADLGIVTTVDINGGTIDGVTIGAAAAGAGTFTALTVNTATAVASLNANYTATTYTSGLGVVDIVRSGALTGVAAEFIIDSNIAPAFTLTEPGAGTITYIGQSIDFTGLLVTAGVGTSVVEGLRIEMSGDADIGTERSLHIVSGAFLNDVSSQFIGLTTIGGSGVDQYSHIRSLQETAPTTTLTNTTLNDGAGAGAAIAVTAGSTDSAGSFTVTAGNGIPTAGIAGQIVFNSAYATAPKIVHISYKDVDGVNNQPYVATVGTGSFEVSFGTALGASEVVEYFYFVVE